MTRREKLAAYGAWASVCFFWGTTYLAIRIGLETFPPLLFAGLRFILAGAVLFVSIRAFRPSTPHARLPQGREWVDVSVVGLMLLGVGTGLVVWAEQWVSSGMAALLVATSPFWVAGIERSLSGGERVGRRALGGMFIGFVGLAVLVAPNLSGASVGGRYILGVLALQIACASWSAGSVYAKHHPTAVAPLLSAALQMLIAGVALTLTGTLAGEWGEVRFSERTLAAFAYLVMFGSIVAYGSYTYAIQKLPLSVVSLYSYINPVIAVLLGWIILKEPLGWRVAAGAVITLGGVALVKSAAARPLTAAAKRPAPEGTDEQQPRVSAVAEVCRAGVD